VTPAAIIAAARLNPALRAVRAAGGTPWAPAQAAALLRACWALQLFECDVAAAADDTQLPQLLAHRAARVRLLRIDGPLSAGAAAALGAALRDGAAATQELQLTAPQGAALAALLPGLPPSVTRLSLGAGSSAGSGEAAGAALAAALAAPRCGLRELNLAGCGLGDAGGAALAAALARNESLTELDLSSNKLGPRAAAALGVALRRPHPALSALGLGGNALGDEGAHSLAEALRGAGPACALRTLTLDSNAIGPGRGARALAGALREPGCPLAALSLRGNPVGDAGVRLLAAALEDNACLAALDLAAAGLGNAAFFELADALRGGAAPALRSLSLSDNARADSAAREELLAASDRPGFTLTL
jgi:hypothetical protein